MPVKQTQWISASVKLECHCTFSIPVLTYEDWWPGETTCVCDNHGEQKVLRVSRLGKS